MIGESYRMSNKKTAENVNDVYRDNKFKLKKRNFIIICVVIILLFAGSILATYFGKTCPSETNTCPAYFCNNPQLQNG